jgi:DNA-binding response OmpR family regulator
MTGTDVTPSPRVLVVDDELTIRTPLVRALELSGYRAEGVSSGKQALQLLNHEPFDVMLLDMKMPEMDGIEVMRRARGLQPALLIIILTGHATLESAIAAVKSDAVDYLLKPASIHDITAAIAHALKKRDEQERPRHLLGTILDALQRAEDSREPTARRGSSLRPASPKPPILHTGAFSLDPEKRLLSIEGVARPIELTEGEATVLTLLMEHPDQVLSCREITRAAWNYDLEEWEAQALVRPYIFRLRQKIEPTPGEPQFLRTVRGRGYLLATD